MGQSRNGYIYAKSELLKSQTGATLITTLILALIISALISGLYIAFNRLFKATEEMRTFTSVKEAAAAGIKYAASMTNIPQQKSCQTFHIDFKITGREGVGRTDIVMCRIANPFKDFPGSELSGTSRDPVTMSSALKSGVFKIVSEARFAEQIQRVEAVYVKE